MTTDARDDAVSPANGPGVAIVTGASSGLGRAVALRLANGGWTTVAVARRAGLLNELAENSPLILPLATDLSVVGSEDRVVAAARRVGKIGVLVANAGFGVKSAFLDGRPQDWARMFDINVLSTMRMCAAAARSMRDVGGGTIVLVSSIAGLRGLPGEAAYCATKAATNSLGESLRLELKDYGIRVTTLCPGTARTEFEHQSMSPAAAQQLYASQGPLEPDEVAELVHTIVNLPANLSIGRLDLRPRNQSV